MNSTLQCQLRQGTWRQATGRCQVTAQSRRQLSRTSAAAPEAVATAPAIPKFETVADIMQLGRIVYSCKPDDTVDHALEILVEHRISGLPVVNQDNVCVGVVSDFDLLALDTLGRTNDNLFPAADQTWQAFKAVKSVLAKGTGKKVKDVMTSTPLTVNPSTSLEEATSMLLLKRIRRLPVVDQQGRLVGIVSRSNMIRAALLLRQAVNSVPA